MKKIRLAINGFGRIGRQTFKIAWERPEVEIIAINDLGDLENIAYLLEFDTVYGRFHHAIRAEGDWLAVDDKKIKYISEPNPSKLPWKELNIDVVIESTGRFTSYEKAKPHLEAGAKRVVLSAPAKDEGQTVTSTPRVNEEMLAKSLITTNASCTTNAITPVMAIMMANPGVKYALLNTIHSITAEQNLVDGPTPPLHKDYRRGRAAGHNIVPTSTGAALATAKAIPGMTGKFDGLALRVPTMAGSILDVTFIAERKTSVEEINRIFSAEAKKSFWQGIMTVSDKPLVSSDILGNPHGAIIDLELTRVVGGELVKIMAWYDNEWGYSHMLLKHVLSLANLL